jgi:hypothetical protein
VTLALVLAAVLAVAVALLVARPWLREPQLAADRLDELSAAQRRRVALAEERDRALAALKELEFDHRTGKITDEHYRELVGPMRVRAAQALRAFEHFEASAQGDQRAMVEVPEPPQPPGEPDPPEPGPEPVPEPYPPPDEGTPPEPARIPEPGPLGAKT